MNKLWDIVSRYAIIPYGKLSQDEMLLRTDTIECCGLPMLTIQNQITKNTKNIKLCISNMFVGIYGVETETELRLAESNGVDCVFTHSSIVANCGSKKLSIVQVCRNEDELSETSCETVILENGLEKDFIRISNKYCGKHFILQNLDNFTDQELIKVLTNPRFVAFMYHIDFQCNPQAELNKAISKLLGYQIMHVGLNGKDESEGIERAKRMSQIFRLDYKEFDKSCFAGSLLESGKMKFPGKFGHIAIGTNSVEHALFYLVNDGIAMRTEFENRRDDGKIIAVYLKEEIGGFAIHLLQK